MSNTKFFQLTACAILCVSTSALADFKGLPNVTRSDNANINIKWESPNPVSIYLLDNPSAKNGKLVAASNFTGAIEIPSPAGSRQYYLLVDTKDKVRLKVAERALSLATTSNFRDIGGYKGFGGKHVKWGMIYRSGGTPMLSADDAAQISKIGLNQMIDLRSDEERTMAPTKIEGVKYVAYNYSFLTMMPQTSNAPRNGATLYHNFPTKFAPQLRIIFAELLKKQVPLEYNCSAGQDRTGFVTAVVLSAMGVSREDIYSDYHLSTTYRKPANEMPPITEEMAKTNPVAGIFAKYKSAPNADKPQVLKEADGTSFLKGSFDEIDSKYGSVENYLIQEIKLTKLDIAKLHSMYLE